MSNEYRHVELLTGDVRRRRWTTEQKLTIIEQSFEPGETVERVLLLYASLQLELPHSRYAWTGRRAISASDILF
jgi:transposase-like protein